MSCSLTGVTRGTLQISFKPHNNPNGLDRQEHTRTSGWGITEKSSQVTETVRARGQILTQSGLPPQPRSLTLRLGEPRSGQEAGFDDG